MPAIEIIMPRHAVPTANEPRFNARLGAFDLSVRLDDGRVTTITTIARNSTDAIDCMDAVYGPTMTGVTPRRLM